MNKRTKKRIYMLSFIAVFTIASFLLAKLTFSRLSSYILSDVEAAAKASEEAFTAGETPMAIEGVQFIDGVSEVSVTPSGRVITRLSVDCVEGPIEMKIALSPNGTVAAIKFLSTSETSDASEFAFLGDYLNNYIGITDPESVDAFTGATFTSNSVKTGVSLAIAQFEILNGTDYKTP